jgi:hypothetical protein
MRTFFNSILIGRELRTLDSKKVYKIKILTPLVVTSKTFHAFG